MEDPAGHRPMVPPPRKLPSLRRRAVVRLRCSSMSTPRASMAALSLGALGVVYGDIGTSPLYAVAGVLPRHRTASRRHRGNVARRALAHLLVADPGRRRSSTCVFIMRADNRGEGGILALLALRPREARGRRRPRRACARSCSASSARRCSTATASSRRRSRCSRRSRASRSATPALGACVVPDHRRDPRRAVR